MMKKKKRILSNNNHSLLRTNVNGNDKIMQEEIFGPILPFITIVNDRDAIEFINARDKPLAFYIFSSDRKLAKNMIEATSAGSTCVNDVIFQIAPLSLPFGGVGASGLGSYHGKYSFDAFSHHRTVVYSPNWCESLLSKRNPPYTKTKTLFVEKMIRIYRRWLPKIDRGFFFWLLAIFLIFLGMRSTMH